MKRLTAVFQTAFVSSHGRKAQQPYNDGLEFSDNVPLTPHAQAMGFGGTARREPAHLQRNKTERRRLQVRSSLARQTDARRA